MRDFGSIIEYKLAMRNHEVMPPYLEIIESCINQALKETESDNNYLWNLKKNILKFRNGETGLKTKEFIAAGL